MIFKAKSDQTPLVCLGGVVGLNIDRCIKVKLKKNWSGTETESR